MSDAERRWKSANSIILIVAVWDGEHGLHVVAARRSLSNSFQAMDFKTSQVKSSQAPDGRPVAPGKSRRGQTCRVVFVGQMTSRRSGESLRPRGRPEGPHIPGRLSSERTRGRRHRHSGQPTRAPATRAAADPNPSPIPNLSLLLNTARKRPRRRGPRVFPAPPQHKAISLDPPSECRTNVGGRVWVQDTQLTQDRVTDHSGPKAVDSRPRSRPFPVRSTWQRNTTVGRVLHHVSTASTVFSI